MAVVGNNFEGSSSKELTRFWWLVLDGVKLREPCGGCSLDRLEFNSVPLDEPSRPRMAIIRVLFTYR